MHGLVFTADPCSGHDFRGHAHEPCVAVLVRGPGLAADLHAVESVVAVQTARRTCVDHALQHREHRVGRAFVDGILRLGDECGDDIALLVFDAGDERGIVVHALICESRECARQFEYVRLRGAQAECRHGVDVAADAHVVDEIGHGFGLLGLFHDPRRVVVAAAGQTPRERVEFAVLLHLARLLGRPRRAVGCFDRNRQVGHHRAGRHAEVVDGERVDEWLDGRADLAFALLGHVVLEVAEVRSADIGFDESRMGINRHEGRTHDAFMMENRIARGHQRVAFALVGEHFHRAGFVERCFDVALRDARLPHFAVAVGVAYGVPDDAFAFLAVGVEEEHFRAFVLCIHAGLDDLLHLVLHGLFGIALHLRVEGRVDFQSVPIDVVGCAVSFAVLAAPAVERIPVVFELGLFVVPIVVELVAAGFVGAHHQPEHFTEIGGCSGVVRYGLIVQHDG